MKILLINIYSIASSCPIGYLSEHLFCNQNRFRIMELYSKDCEIYKNFTDHRMVTFNSIRIKQLARNEIKLQTASLGIGRKMNWLKEAAKFLIPVTFDRTLLNDIRSFAPDIIYTQGYDVRLLKVVHKLSHILRCPVITHTLDNWLSDKVLERYIEICSLKAVMNRKYIHFAGSPSMVDFLHEKFHVKSEFISNCTPYCNNSPSLMSAGKEIKILYAGNLTPDRYKSLNMIAKALRELSNKINIALYVYAPVDQLKKYKTEMEESIILHESVPQDQIQKIYHEADFLLHVESFGIEYHNFIRYSLSTKIAEYLAIKRPLLYYGPLDVGVARFLIENKIGIVADNNVDLLNSLKCIISSSEMYSAISQNGYFIGRKFFDSIIVQKKLYNVLEQDVNIYKQRKSKE